MSLVITTLRVLITGKVLLIYYALPSGMRSRSAANFVGDIVGVLDVCMDTPRCLLIAASLSCGIDMV